MTTDERVAVHEAGHAWVALACGRRVRLVSIRPGRAYAGVAARHPQPPLDTSDLGRPVPLLHAGFRRAIEVDIMVALGGQLAEDAFLPGSRYRSDPVNLLRETAPATAVRRLSRPARALLAELEVADDAESDDRKAVDAALALSGDPLLAGLHLQWLRGVARSLIVEPKGMGAIGRIAEALMERTVLGERTLRRIAKGKEGA